VVSSHIGGVAVEEAVPLAPLTSLRIGPVARRLLSCTTTDQLIAVLRELADVRIANTGVTIEGNVLRAEAGAVWDDVVAASLEHGLGGLECLSGIPGSTGATPVQNVGAYGAEVADTITRVRLLDRRSGRDAWVAPDALRFGYRHSVLKNSDDAVVLEVEFTLDAEGRSAPVRYGELARVLGVEPGTRTDPARVRAAVLDLRGSKGMVLDDDDRDTWSVGSFFTNPVVGQADFERLRAQGPLPSYPAQDGVKLAAGWLVEHAGFGKGYPGDGAAATLSTKHALALTNRGSATTADVLALARTVRDGVRNEFGIDLTPEPCLIGCSL
jgi:UDP-N-acetylmuramate dehydrogenase